MSGAARALVFFWGVLIVLTVGGLAALQALGPKSAPAPPVAGAAPAQIAPPQIAPVQAAPARAAAPAPSTYAANNAAWPGPALPQAGAPIAAAEPALLEPAHDFPGTMLPRIGPGQRLPMRAYAGGYDPADTRPRIGFIIAGIGVTEDESEEAVRSVAPAIDLAVSPYTARPQRLLDLIRAHGHEFLLGLPMEPQGYPQDDEGPQELLAAAPPAQNQLRLQWVLSRIAGYAGVTGACEGLRGEHYAASPELMGAVQDELAARGLFYIDPRPGAAPPARVAGRSIDEVVDEPAVHTEIDAKLNHLEHLARSRGSALGLADLPRPVTVDEINAWAGRLAAHGIALVPVSALVQPAASAAAASAAAR
ncbi:MAG: divergent polysaccharide deacetylase family protein [Acidisphaera sp.]|nr:divergent polysaccharide deacetylase family protein [Acidisphaera sp.]